MVKGTLSSHQCLQASLGRSSYHNLKLCLAPQFKPVKLIIIGLPIRATLSRKMEATSSVQQNDKMVDGTPRRFCVSHSPFNGADFCGEGTGNFRSSGETIWESNSKLLRGVIGPMSTANDDLNTEFDDVVSLCGSCRNNALPLPPKEKPRLVAILSLRARKSLSFKERNNRYAICRSLCQTERYSIQ